MEILAVKNLSFSYSLSSEKVLKNVSFSVKKGEFLTICGATGSGKTTLLRLLKPQLAPNGVKEGTVSLFGKDTALLSEKETACKIGYVMQRPEQQIVTDKVWHELAFGLENRGLPSSDIRRRVAEMACYFGIEDWFEKDVHELSGGQKQLLSLASVMVMQPDILLLDEPTAQLDPIASMDFISTVRKLNRDFSLTVLMIEHRLEDVIPLSDRLLVLEKGAVLIDDETRSAVAKMQHNLSLLPAMPAATRLFAGLRGNGQPPVTQREGHDFLENAFSGKVFHLSDEKNDASAEETALEFSHIYFRYQKELPDVLRDLSFSVHSGEIFCILGGNGSGKSTALAAATSLCKPYAGKIRVFGKPLKDYKNQSLYKNCLTLLPQDVQTVFLRNTVREELEDANISSDALPFDITRLLDRHPYDLSGGQQQLVALGKALGQKPRLLLLDEPTKGLDAYTRNRFIDVLKQLKDRGMTIVAVTHDVEFAALCADRCALFFRGEIVSCDSPRRFFTDSSFYTTAACRMARGICQGAATVADLLSALKQGGANKT